MTTDRFRIQGSAETAQARSEQHPDLLVPTHTCFDDAGQYMLTTCMGAPQGLSFTVRDDDVPPLLEKVGKGAAVTIVHALVSIQGHKSAHAWVEHGPLIMETFWHQGRKTVHAQKAETFLQSVAVLSSVRYTPTEAYELWDQHGYAGPWDVTLLWNMARREAGADDARS